MKGSAAARREKPPGAPRAQPSLGKLGAPWVSRRGLRDGVGWGAGHRSGAAPLRGGGRARAEWAFGPSASGVAPHPRSPHSPPRPAPAPPLGANSRGEGLPPACGARSPRVPGPRTRRAPGAGSAAGPRGQPAALRSARPPASYWACAGRAASSANPAKLLGAESAAGWPWGCLLVFFLPFFFLLYYFIVEKFLARARTV